MIKLKPDSRPPTVPSPMAPIALPPGTPKSIMKRESQLTERDGPATRVPQARISLDIPDRSGMRRQSK